MTKINSLSEFKFPELNEAQIAFSTLKADKQLLDLAKEKGFYNGNKEANKWFSTLFYNGGKIEFKKNIDEDYINKGMRYFRGLISSFEPKHEEKEAVCSLILEEFVKDVK
jgi:hypothetical protein